MINQEWVCYLIKSTDSNKTYVGATNNLERRLNDHCGLNGISKGAKATKGEMWYVLLFISGFKTKQECLSFEYQFKRMRNQKYDLSKFKLNNLSSIDKRINDLYKLFLQNKAYHKWNKEYLIINLLENIIADDKLQKDLHTICKKI